MFRNYFITALRNFRKNKLYAIINIIGLGLGIACCFAQYAILKHEYSFDSFHEKSDQIYRVVEQYAGDNGMQYSAYLPNPLGHTLDEEISTVETIPIQGPLSAKIKVRSGETFNVFQEDNNLIFSNSNFLRYFNFPLVDGFHSNQLDELNQVYISERQAKKYFNTIQATGKTLEYGSDLKLTVAGVLKDIPYNTNIHFDLLISYTTIRKIYPQWTATWGAKWQGTSYLIKGPDQSKDEIEHQIASITKTHLSEEDFLSTKYYLQPLDDVHTNERYSDAPNYVPPKEALLGSLLTVILILLVSVFNFINLATSQSIRRSKEVGIRKTLGGQRKNLVFQFFVETGTLVLIATILGLTIGQVLLNLLNEAVQPFPFKVEYDQSILIFSIVIFLIVTLLAGSYPSIILARLSPTQAIRNQLTLSVKSERFSLRKVMTVTQFAVANLLLIVTIIATSQMQYIFKKDLGFSQSGMLQLHFTGQTTNDLDYIRQDLASLSFVKEATRCMGPPQTGYSWNSLYNLVGQPSTDVLFTNLKFIDEYYLEAYQIPLIAGRNITNTLLPDSIQQIIVNEEFIKRLELTPSEAVGRRVEYNGQYTGTIIGVVQNFHVDKLDRQIRPVTMTYQPREMNDIGLKISSNEISSILPVLEDKFRSYDPEGVFQPLWLSEQIRNSYLFEKAMQGTFQTFAILAIIIGLLGLYGLVNFMISRNRKALSIRKVFGASTQQVFTKITGEYVILIAIAFAVSTPFAWFVMNNWLDNFAYHIAIEPWHFIVSLLTVFTISMLTVGSKSYKAANTNPVDILRHE